MKTLCKAFPIGLLGSLGLGIWSAVADLEVSATVQIHGTAEFYEPLAPQGAWIEVGSYGRCWHPAHVGVEWRPYCHGAWVWTDCGWYWESDEPWAWACYHYGNWVYDPVYAWVWVPGIEWGPAWVSWRFGGGYIGWAPLPPGGIFVARAGVIAPAPFVFVEVNRFHEPIRPSAVIINNTTIINKTTQINNIRQETRTIAGAGPRKVMVNEGPGLEAVQKASNKKVQMVSIHEAVRQTPVPSAVTRHPSEPKSTERPAASPPAAGRELPREHHENGKPPPQGEVRPSPERPPMPGAQPGSAPHPPREKGQGKGHER